MSRLIGKKIFLIQLLNIAGLGPIFGAISGALWGPVAFLWIVFGCIFAGAVHDYFSGMLSVRNNGASVSEITGTYLGSTMKNVMRVFSVILLVLVGTVFMTGPAQLLANLTPESLTMNFWLVVVLAYYFFATILPIDKIIGRFYPLFGIILIIMAVGITEWDSHARIQNPRIDPGQPSSEWTTDLATDVCDHCLRRDQWFPCHPIADDGEVYSE